MLNPNNVKSTVDLPSTNLRLIDNTKLRRFLEGFKAVQADQTITQYMHRHHLLDDTVTSVDQFNGIYSKFRWLGE